MQSVVIQWTVMGFGPWKLTALPLFSPRGRKLGSCWPSQCAFMWCAYAWVLKVKGREWTEGKLSEGEGGGMWWRARSQQLTQCSWNLGLIHQWKATREGHTQPKLILQVSKANSVICPFPEEIGQPVLPPLEDLMWRKTRGKIIMMEMRNSFARLWTHKVKIIIFLSIVPFRGENCNAHHPVSINCSHAINSCAGVETWDTKKRDIRDS